MNNRVLTAVLCGSFLLQGCSPSWQQPRNTGGQDNLYAAEGRDFPSSEGALGDNATRWNMSRCSPLSPVMSSGYTNEGAPLSTGDLVQLVLPNNETPSGYFKVEANGNLNLGPLGILRVSGLNIEEAESVLQARLVSTGYFRPGHSRATLRMADRAPLRVFVNGAVFVPGRPTINTKSHDDRDGVYDTAGGDISTGRSLSNALFSGGGVRPDADIAHVHVKGTGGEHIVDVTGIISGHRSEDPVLREGDEVSVPSRGCFQTELARPSPITPPGIRVFVSNLTVPANSNASSAINKDATNVPYGTRLTQAMIGANCVGGTQSTNANRFVVLMSINPATGRMEVVERRIENLVRRSDRDGFNPVLMPGDAIACYDSAVTNIQDIMKSVVQAISSPAR